MIDEWDHPSTAWSVNFAKSFDEALGFEIDNEMELWEFGEEMLDLIDTSKMLLADIKEWANGDETDFSSD